METTSMAFRAGQMCYGWYHDWATQKVRMLQHRIQTKEILAHSHCGQAGQRMSDDRENGTILTVDSGCFAEDE